MEESATYDNDASIYQNPNQQQSLFLSQQDAPFKWWMYVRHFGVRTFIVALVCLFAFFIPDLHLLITLVGAVFGTIISVVLPVLFYNRAYRYPEGSKHFMDHYNSKKARPNKEKEASVANPMEGGEEEPMIIEDDM